MGLFQRLHRITIGRIEAFLDRVEDPELVFPVLVKEMEEQLRAAGHAEAKAKAAHKQAQRDLDNLVQQMDKYGRGAAHALEQNNETMARQAVEAQIDCEKKADDVRANLDRAQNALEHAQASRKRIQQQLEELQSKKDEILTRARVAKTQKKIQQTVSGSSGSSESILDAVARLEAGIEEAEAQLEIQGTIAGSSPAGPSLDRRIAELDRNAEIEKRLALLRSQVKSQAHAGQ